MKKPINYNSKTTGPQDELLCHVTKSDKVIGPIARKICHNETTRPWHRSVHLYLFDKKGRLYLTQRSSHTQFFYPKFQISTRPTYSFANYCGSGRMKYNQPIKEY